ncbi:CLUMA_CG008855, isoform A [Clunio marinus]|uniref:CLUMA_CG008855, isoform A n=1 Tax=Clunio marinus TaxID=568069 RepID=A0A1J1I4N9_9DIPT|nr:CLUMA_CG008855, isoform A [Clunio marinus]
MLQYQASARVHLLAKKINILSACSCILKRMSGRSEWFRPKRLQMFNYISKLFRFQNSPSLAFMVFKRTTLRIFIISDLEVLQLKRHAQRIIHEFQMPMKNHSFARKHSVEY